MSVKIKTRYLLFASYRYALLVIATLCSAFWKAASLESRFDEN